MSGTVAASLGDPAAGKASFRARAWAWYVGEMRHLVPPTLFFFVGFNLIVLTTNLILANYYVAFGSFLLATMAALVVGKAVLVADLMPVVRRFDGAPLIQPILFKTVVYCLCVMAARLIEAFVEYVWHHGSPAGFGTEMLETFSWHRFAAIQIWVFVLFLVYVTASELNALFGNGELWRILFRHRSSDLRLTRRQRVRELVLLGRLAARRPEAIGVPGTAANGQLMAIVRKLGERR